MAASAWIKQARKAGWRVASNKDGVLSLSCTRIGCTGHREVPIANLGPPPEPCSLPHHGQYGEPVFNLYRRFVADLVKRRRRLGLSQEVVNAAAGFTDGHLNKLESFARIGQFSTMVTWVNTLGMDLTISTDKLPDQKARAIEDREALLRGSKNCNETSNPGEVARRHAPKISNKK